MNRKTTVTSDVTAFDLEWPAYDEPLSVQLIRTAEAVVLFGAGDESTAEQIVELAREHAVDVVVVEHGDADHYGGVPALRDSLDVEIAAPAGDEHYLEAAGIAVDVPLEADETYWGIRTVSVPGHTDDNMSYLYDGVLVAGDSLAGTDSMFAADSSSSDDCAFSVIVPDYNENDELARESVRNLLDYEFDIVLVAHGSDVLKDGYSEVEKLVAIL